MQIRIMMTRICLLFITQLNFFFILKTSALYLLSHPFSQCTVSHDLFQSTDCAEFKVIGKPDFLPCLLFQKPFHIRDPAGTSSHKDSLVLDIMAYLRRYSLKKELNLFTYLSYRSQDSLMNHIGRNDFLSGKAAETVYPNNLS